MTHKFIVRKTVKAMENAIRLATLSGWVLYYKSEDYISKPGFNFVMMTKRGK